MTALLRATALFRGLGDAPLRLLASHAAMRELPAAQVAIQAGEAGTSLYLVLEGLLSADAGRRSVRDPLPATLRPGDLFDPAILRGEAHGSTVRCRTAVLLCEFGPDALQALFGAGAGTMERVARNLVAGPSSRSNEDEERVADTLRQMRHLFPAPVGRQGPGIGPVANTG